MKPEVECSKEQFCLEVDYVTDEFMLYLVGDHWSAGDTVHFVNTSSFRYARFS